MDTIELSDDIKVFYITADTFPEGALAAHQKLHELVPFSQERKYFGISRPEQGKGIVYRAGTDEQYPGESGEYQCDTLVLKKGKYVSLDVKGYREDPLRIEAAFQQLLKYPGLDPQGYCVEWYSNDENTVVCMIRLEDVNN